MLFATHYLDEADHVADRILVLDHGRIVGDGSPAALKATVTERTVRFALADAGPAADARAPRAARGHRPRPARHVDDAAQPRTPTRPSAAWSRPASRSGTSRSPAPTSMPPSSP